MIARLFTKEQARAFVDKQTGIVIWMRLSANTDLADADWSNMVAIGQLIERKLN